MRISDWSSDVCSSDLLDFERFEEIARLDVGEVLGEGHAAFEPGPNLGDVVLEPAQRRDLALIDDDILARDARLQRLAEHALGRSEERRVGKEGVSPCRSRWSTYH